MTLEEKAARLYPHSKTMQERYIKACQYAQGVVTKVIVGKEVHVATRIPRTERDAFQGLDNFFK